MKKTTVHLSPFFNHLLTEITEKRKRDNQQVKTKQGVMEQILKMAHKKEMQHPRGLSV